jgi:hypothetical protein
MKKAIIRLSILAVLAGGAWYGYRTFKQSQTRQEKIATAKVQRSDVTIRAFTRGELKAVRVYPLYSPTLNGTIQVTALAPAGALAREKNLVVEYDDSELLGTIEADKLTLDTTDENIKYLTLTMQVQTSKNDVNKLLAEFAVKRAELQVKKNPVLDAITQKSNILALTQAVRALAQTVTNIEMLKAQQDSQMAVYNSTRRRSLQALQLDQGRLLQTKTLAPMTGLVAIKQNRAGNFNFGQQMPDIRPGDQLQAGMNVADLLDLSEMELTAKVGELDRANLKEGQDILIQLDAIPDKRFPGKIKTLSGTATSDVFSGDPSKKFDVSFTVDMRALLTGVGMQKQDIDQIMNTATENAKKNLISFAPTVTGGRGGGGGAPGMDFGGGLPGGPPPDLAALAALANQGGGGQGQGGFGGRGQGGGGGQGGFGAQGGGGRGPGGGGMSNISDADRQTLSDLRQKIRDASSDAEREKLQQQQQELMAKLGIQGRGGRQGGPNAPGGQGGDMAGGQGRGQRGGGGGDMAGGQGRGQRGGGGGGGSNVFVPTQEELDNAALPIPPEQDSGVTKLLRPGLLADVEIQVESIPNALHVPSQAIYRQGGKPIVYVQGKDGKFSPRAVELVKQSESFMVLASGVEAGEVVALSDPTLSKSDKMSKTEEKKGSGTGMPMPGAN